MPCDLNHARWHSLFRVRSSLQKGDMPTEDLTDALLIFVAGIVLLTPGFLTDMGGLLLLLPVTRGHFKRSLKRKLDNWIRNHNIHYTLYH